MISPTWCVAERLQSSYHFHGDLGDDVDKPAGLNGDTDPHIWNSLRRANCSVGNRLAIDDDDVSSDEDHVTIQPRGPGNRRKGQGLHAKRWGQTQRRIQFYVPIAASVDVLAGDIFTIICR